MAEHEAKVLLGDEESLPDASDLLDRLGEWIEDTITLDATYFDTPDLRLTRAGVSVRWRDDGWTVKTPGERDATSLVRGEYTFAGPPGAPPAVVEELVLGWTRGAHFDEVAHISTRRHRLRLLDDHTDAWVEVDDDRVTTSSLLAPTAIFHEVEIELRDPDRRDAFDAIVERVRAATRRSDRAIPKIARALGAPAERPEDVPSPAPITRRATTAQLIRWRIQNAVHRIVTYDHLVRLDEDTSAVHQARVATRRLRADLKLFSRHLEPRAAERLEDELHWFAGLLGGVRDADVLLAALTERAPAADDADRADAVIERLQQVRADRRVVLLDAMTSPRYLALLDDLVDVTKRPPLRPGASKQRASKHAKGLVHRAWKKLRRTVRRLPAHPDDDQLHDVRKRAKHLRYAAEAVEPVTGKRMRRVARRASTLQDVLGEHHDAVVASQWLTETATSIADDGAFAAGELAAGFHADADRSRHHWRRAWKRTRRAYADA